MISQPFSGAASMFDGPKPPALADPTGAIKQPNGQYDTNSLMQKLQGMYPQAGQADLLNMIQQQMQLHGQGQQNELKKQGLQPAF